MKIRKHSDVKQAYQYTVEAETIPGLEAIAQEEIVNVFPRTASGFVRTKGAIQFRFNEDLQQLRNLKTVHAAHVLLTFQVPRPKALLSNEFFPRILESVDQVRSSKRSDNYRTLHLSAAGRSSSVMQRIASELTNQTGLSLAEDQGDIAVRIRPSAHAHGWDVLIRVGNRPLATRSWRVCNYEGALNATVAHAMVLLSKPSPDDCVLNAGSGSGSLLIERGSWGPSKLLVGVDNDDFALRCAQRNLDAVLSSAAMLCGDITELPFPLQAFDVILTDLPFGQLTGSHSDNISLYPAFLTEAARVSRSGSRLVVITHEVRLLDDVITKNAASWEVLQVLRITLRGLHPRIYVLKRRESTGLLQIDR